MKIFAYIVLVAVVFAAFIQPLIETANLLAQKVTLDAAILNSCRAARNNALMDLQMSDLNAEIDEDTFKQYFAEAFAATLDLNISSTTGLMRFTSSTGRWGDIEVDLQLAYNNAAGQGGRGMTRAEVNVTAGYVFRTPILSRLVGMSDINHVGDDLHHKRGINVQIIN